MAQDSRTVNDILTNALYLINAISPDRIPPEPMISRALYLLNDLLDSFSSLGVFIPFIKTIDVTLVPNQGTYSISNIVPADFNFNRIVELDFINFNIDSMIYPVDIVDRAVILNNVRYPQGATRPGAVYMDKQDTLTQLIFYPVPDQAYACQIRAKFMFDRLSLFQVITEVPPHYYRFLRYAVGRELDSYYPSSSWNEKLENEYQMLLKNVKAAVEINLLLKPDGILMQPYRNAYYILYGLAP